MIWRYIPDPAEAADALAAGEVDWREIPPLDFIPKIEQDPALRTFVPDPLGTQGWLRPNHLHPQFNNKKARQALLSMMDQVKASPWTTTTGRRNPGSEPDGSGKSAHQTSPCEITIANAGAFASLPP